MVPGMAAAHPLHYKMYPVVELLTCDLLGALRQLQCLVRCDGQLCTGDGQLVRLATNSYQDVLCLRRHTKCSTQDITHDKWESVCYT